MFDKWDANAYLVNLKTTKNETLELLTTKVGCPKPKCFLKHAQKNDRYTNCKKTHWQVWN
jgi:hypothetical protein